MKSSYKEKNFFIQGPAGKIELSIFLPEASSEISRIGIICHPHPLFGGTMQNKVVTTLAKTFLTKGYAAIRFNFRGVGQSEGEYDTGKGEVEDLRAVIQWAKEHYPSASISLAGFSFGSYVAAKLTAENSELIQQLILIAPAVGRFNFDELTSFPCPIIVVQGEEDEVVAAEVVYAWVKRVSSPIKLIKFPQTTHFFHGKLQELKDSLVDFL